MKSRSLHLVVETQDGGGRVQAQVFANVAAAGDLAAQQQCGRVQRARAADHILGLDDKPEMAPAWRCGGQRRHTHSLALALASTSTLLHQDLVSKDACRCNDAQHRLGCENVHCMHEKNDLASHGHSRMVQTRSLRSADALLQLSDVQASYMRTPVAPGCLVLRDVH